MLDPNHPLTAHRFAALQQIQLIHQFAYRISLGIGRSRRDYYNIIKPAIVALHWLNENHFANRPEIRETIASLDQELLTLVDKPHDESDVEIQRSCPVCKAAITEVGLNQPHGAELAAPKYRYCEQCFKLFSNLLEKMKSSSNGFGLDAI